MFEILIISIGLVLVVEGAIYFLFADKLDYLVSFLKSVDTKKIKKVSLIIIFIGFCLIYFTFRNYNEIN